MLEDKQIATEGNLNFRSNMHDAGEDHVFDEVTSGTFMRDAEIVSGAYPDYEYEVLLLSLYTDAASPDFRRRASLSPIVIGKRNASFFPKIKVRRLNKCIILSLKHILHPCVKRIVRILDD